MPKKLSTTAWAFRNALKSKLRSLPPGPRKLYLRRVSKKLNQKWVYPLAYEKTLEKLYRDTLKEFITYAMTIIKRDLPWWLKEFNREDSAALLLRSTSTQFCKDGFIDEWASLVNGLNLLQKDKFDNEKKALLGNILSLGGGMSAFNEKQWAKITQAFLGQRFYVDEPWMKPAMEAWAENNFTMMKSYSQDFIRNVNRVVSSGVQEGWGYDRIMKDLVKNNLTFERMKPRLAARDQIGRFNSLVTKQRMENAGIEMYVWETSMDERVRGNPAGLYPDADPSHWVMQGLICRWDDPSVYLEDGIKWKSRTAEMPQEHPGIPPLCRCAAVPFFREMVEETETELNSETEYADEIT